jgi:tight adherence protein B
MEGLVIGTLFGFGVLLVFDALIRPEAKPDIRTTLARIGPKGAGAAAGALVGLALTGWPVAAITGAILGSLLPQSLLNSRAEKEQLQKLEALAFVSARLRDTIRSGIGFQEALSHVADNAPSVIGRDLQRYVIDMRVSGPEAAGAAFVQRFHHYSAELFGSALSLSEKLGSRNTSEILDSLSEATSAHAATLREARSRQTRQRVSARIVGAAPLVLLIAIKRSNPGYLEPFDAFTGQLVLGMAFALIAAGYAAMARVARLERPAR